MNLGGVVRQYDQLIARQYREEIEAALKKHFPDAFLYIVRGEHDAWRVEFVYADNGELFKGADQNLVRDLLQIAKKEGASVVVQGVGIAMSAPRRNFELSSEIFRPSVAVVAG